MKAILSNTTRGVYRAMVNEIKKSLNEQKMVTVIVPDYFSMSVQKALLESLDKECTFHLEVEPFKNLARKALGEKMKRCLTQEGSVMLISDVIDKNKDQMEYYKQSAGREGFSEEFADAINTLRVSGISIDSLFNLQDELPTSTAHKLHDLAFVYKKYLETLSNKYNDKSTMLDLYAEYLINQQKDYNHDYFIMDFYYFSATQYAIIKGLENAGNSVVIGLAYGFDNPNAKIYPAQNIIDKLEELGLDIKKTKYIEELSPAKDIISKYLFSLMPVGKKVENNGTYAFYKANSVYDEVLRVALDIKNKVMNEGRRYQNFEIVCAQPNEYYNNIISIFKRLGIPFYIDQKSKLTDQTFVRYLLSMFSVVSGGYKRADVFDMVKNPLFVYIYGYSVDQDEQKIPEDELDVDEEGAKTNTNYLDDIHQFENYSLKYNINYTLFKKPFEIKDKYDDELLTKAEKIRAFMCEKLSSIDEINKENVFIDTFVKVLKDICTEANYAWQAHIKEIGKVSQYYEKCAQQVNKKLDMILDEISIIMHNTTKSLSGFLDMLKTMIENVPIASVPVYRDSVYVGDTRSRFVGTGKIYVIGAAQGAFPGVEKNGIILSDKDELNMENVGLLISPSTKEKNYIQDLGAIEVLKKSSETTDISYSTSVVGGHIRPSVVFQQINSLLCDGNKELEMHEIDLEDISSMSDSEKMKMYETLFSTSKSRYYSVLKTLIPHRIAGEENETIYETIYNMLDSEDKDKIQDLFEDQDYVDHGELLLGETEDGLYKSSVSKIESFYRCPYAYYLSYGLGLREREDAQMQRYETGTIIHKVLEIFMKDYYMKGQVNKENIKEITGLCFSGAIDEMPRYKNMALNEKKGLFQKLLVECEELCTNIFNSIENSDFKPLYVEKSFSIKDKKFKPITLDVDGKKINIVGKIDRVDKCGDDVFIIDYKTYKNADIDLTELYYGTQIQLMMYLRTIEQNTDYHPIGAFYLPIYASYDKKDVSNRFKYTGVVLNDPVVHKNIDNNYSLENAEESMVPFKLKGGKAPSPEVFAEERDLENWEKYAELISQKGLETIVQGYVKAKPKDQQCRLCGYADVCKYKNTNSRKFSKAKIEDFENIVNENKGGQENG